ncbi:hypothetical protein RCL1_003325 [Eukaryota sp. TZLM3-RCL]
MLFVPFSRWCLELASAFGEPDLLGPFRYSLEHSIHESRSLSVHSFKAGKKLTCPPVTAVLLTSGVVYRSLFDVLSTVDPSFSHDMLSSSITESLGVASRMGFLPVLTFKYHSSLTPYDVSSNPASLPHHSELMLLFARAFADSPAWIHWVSCLNSCLVVLKNKSNLTIIDGCCDIFPANSLSSKCFNFMAKVFMVASVLYDFDDSQISIKNDCESIFNGFLFVLNHLGIFSAFKDLTELNIFIKNLEEYGGNIDVEILFVHLLFCDFGILMSKFIEQAKLFAPELLENFDKNSDVSVSENLEENFDKNSDVSVSENLEENFDKNSDVSVSENLEENFDINSDVSVSENLEENFDKNSDVSVSENLEENFDKNSDVSVSENLEQNLEVSVLENLDENFDINSDVSVSENLEENFDKNSDVSVSENLEENFDKNSDVSVSENLEQNLEVSVLENLEENFDKNSDVSVSENLEENFDINSDVSGCENLEENFAASTLENFTPNFDQPRSPPFQSSYDPVSLEDYEDERFSQLLGITKPPSTTPSVFSSIELLSKEEHSDSDSEEEINRLIDELYQNTFQLSCQIDLKQSLRDSLCLKNVSELISEVRKLRVENSALKNDQTPLQSTVTPQSTVSAEKPPFSPELVSKLNKTREKIAVKTIKSCPPITSSSTDVAIDDVIQSKKPAIAFEIPVNNSKQKKILNLHNGPYNGPLVPGLEPTLNISRPNNKNRILLAIKKNILAGGVNKSKQDEVFSVIESQELGPGGFFVLSLSSNLQYRGLYVFPTENSNGNLVHGIGPTVLTAQKVVSFHNYDTGSGLFNLLTTINFSNRVDAVVIKVRRKILP